MRDDDGTFGIVERMPTELIQPVILLTALGTSKSHLRARNLPINQ